MWSVDTCQEKCGPVVSQEKLDYVDRWAYMRIFQVQFPNLMADFLDHFLSLFILWDDFIGELHVFKCVCVLWKTPCLILAKLLFQTTYHLFFLSPARLYFVWLQGSWKGKWMHFNLIMLPFHNFLISPNVNCESSNQEFGL